MIKALPQLQKLDNIQVTQDELKEAQRKGRNLIHPNDAQDDTEEEEEEYQQPQYNNRYQQEYSEYSSPPQSTPIKLEVSILITECCITYILLFFIYTHCLY